MTRSLVPIVPNIEQVKKTQRLLEMLRYGRPANSNMERAFIKRFLDPYKMEEDNYGNYYHTILDKNGKQPIVLWSCHTDTAHHGEGFQQLHISEDEISLQKNSKATCLGADDTTGVWILLEMIDANVPGLYIFHRAEEVGGKGSKYIKENCRPKLEGIQYAIAFDRRGKDSIITFQGGRRCASNEFATSIGPMLPEGYLADTTGSFTDTATYMDFIPECSNISVGYNHEHWKDEIQSISHALLLRDAMLKFDYTQLVCKRDPKIVESKWNTTHYAGGSYGVYEDGRYSRSGFNGYRAYDYLNENDSTASTSNMTLQELVEKYPNVAADLLESMGIDAREFLLTVAELFLR